MLWGVLGTALLMGLAGGPHCLAMCAAPCARIAAPQRAQPLVWVPAGMPAALPQADAMRLAALHAGRLAGYAALGALAATAISGFAQGVQWAAALRPAWALLQLLVLLWGLTLLVWARQPAWMERASRRLWARVQQGLATRGRVLALGLAWACLPCGLLYSAVAVAALTGSAAGGAAAMLAFGAGGTLWLVLGPWLLARAGRAANAWRQDLGARLAGAVLVLMSGWALWMHALQRGPVLWC
ncbi:hypothetical protein GCM10027082_07360 [Comamonas humi]